MNKQKENIDETILLKVLEDTAEDKERSLFTQWIEASPDHADYFESLKNTHNFTFVEKHSKTKNWEMVVRKVNDKVEVPEYIESPGYHRYSIRTNRNLLVRTAAAFIILLGISFLLRITIFEPDKLIISGNNLRPNEAYLLADGSKVYLNGNSELTISKKFGIKNRIVTLKGEAFFEVQRNESLPFRITTLNTTIQVLGTRFNVYSNLSEQVRVSVVSGSVEFYTGNKKELVQLAAGDQGIYDPTFEGIEKVNINNRNFLSWKTGILYFDETPVSEAFQVLQKHYSQVLILDEGNSDILTLTTTIDNQSLEAVLEELNLLLSTSMESRNDTIFFKSN